MSEYIKKEDVYQILNIVTCVGEIKPSVAEIDIEAFESIPAEDVEPVVRCKDCAKRRTHLCNMCKPVKDDEFCSDGATRIIKDYERAAHMERSGSGE